MFFVFATAASTCCSPMRVFGLIWQERGWRQQASCSRSATAVFTATSHLYLVWSTRFRREVIYEATLLFRSASDDRPHLPGSGRGRQSNEGNNGDDHDFVGSPNNDDHEQHNDDRHEHDIDIATL